MIIVFVLWPLPDYAPSFSKILYSNEHTLLSGIVSDEEQWCFPMDDSIPPQLTTCIILYEDQYFYYHLGINPIAVGKAILHNLNHSKKIGASTIPMQLMRLKSKSKDRTLGQKCKEAISAIKYSLTHSKSTILQEWMEIAPFGGNIIGIKAASLFYFGRSLDKLSWSEYALLAVMPNGPSHANLTKNRQLLKAKRNELLEKLYHNKYFTKDELALYQDEDLPNYTNAMPKNSYHFLQYLIKENPNQHVFHSTINHKLQASSETIIQQYCNNLQKNNIRNVSAVIIDNENNTVLTYVGNVPKDNNTFSYVDIAQSPRSYGSLLKPFLYGYAMEQGHYLPHELIPDMPITVGSFQPENFDKKFRGMVPMSDMVIQSLNVPSVRILQKVGLHQFYYFLTNLQIDNLDKGVNHYGLSLILGGGETSLWELCRIYKGLARNLLHYPNPYNTIKTLSNKYLITKSPKVQFSDYAVQNVVNTMADLTRPREEKSWQYYGGDHRIAWKTGTSYGHKDAWAIGFNARYTVGVWVGNENGEGRYDLTGISKAAPILFTLFSQLGENKWFSSSNTISTKNKIQVCEDSGKLAGELCTHTSSNSIGNVISLYETCNFHKLVYYNQKHEAIDPTCGEMVFRTDTFFSIPGNMEYYYKESNIEYKLAPIPIQICEKNTASAYIIYPHNGHKIFLPIEKDNQKNLLIVKGYHRDKKAKVFWFINGKHYTTTKDENHNFSIQLSRGRHTITMLDEVGAKDEIIFDIIDSNRPL